MKLNVFTSLALVSLTTLFISCSDNGGGGGINLFTIDQDIAFGEQMDSMIVNTPAEYPVLDRATNATAYRYIEDMLEHILDAEDIKHRDDFEWKITIIDDDVMNAFATPGGKLYFYTGIIHYLDDASQLAGVLAHEVAHSDRRHSTQMLTKQYGFSLLLSVILGDSENQLALIAANLAQGLAGLSFSRENEYEADEYSVRYLAEGNKYYAKGISGFFIKLRAEGQTSQTFEFLSTHPDDEHRLENIDAVYEGLSNKGAENTFVDDYNDFKALLRRE